MATRNLDAYKLAVVLDAAGAAKGISALAEADRAATRLDSSFDKLGKSAVRGFNDVKKAAVDNSQKTQQALASALLAGKKNVGGLISEARKAQAEFRALEKAEEKALRLSGGGFFSRAAARVGGLPGLSHVSNIIQGLPQIGNLARSVLDPFAELAETGLEFNMLVEDAELGFEGVTGGIKEANRYVKELTDFAADNPIFNTQGTVRGARQMAIFGFETKRTTDYLKVWGGALAKGGQFNEETLASVVRGFGQIRQLQTVTAEDMNILQDVGIPAWELLAKAIGKNVAETRKLAEARKLNGAAAVDAMTEMLRTDPRFAGGADAFAKGLRGRLAQAQDLREVAAGQAMRGTAAELRDTLEAAMTGHAPTIVNRMAQGMDAALTPVAKIIGASVKGTVGGAVTSGLAEGIDATKSVVTEAVKGMGLGSLRTLMDVLGINSPSLAFKALGQFAGQGYALGLREALKDLAKEHGGDLRKYLETLAQDPRFKAWFETIRQVEGGRPNVMAGGRTVNSGRRHPGQVVPRDEWFMGPKGRSSAAGNWQMTWSNWKVIAPFLGLDNFSDVDQQMMAALVLFAAEGGDKALLKGDMGGALKASRPWAATPRSHLPGRKPLGSEGFIARYNQLLTGGMAAGGRANAVPVVVVGSEGGADITGGDTFVKRDEYSPEFGGIVSVARSREEWAAIDLERARIRRLLPDVNRAVEQVKVDLSGVTLSTANLPPVIASTGIGLRMLEEQARQAGRGMGETARDWAKEVMGSADKLSTAMGAFGQISGMIPGQQVGKKRGFFSKMLGFAAPFLNFIPGVGPILSTLAGIGSSALAGDWGGAVSGAVAGFSQGGAFRRSSSNSGSTNSAPTSTPGAGLEPRAHGGPVRKGRAYTVGDRGPRQYWEVFEPEQDGHVYPSVEAYEQSRGARGGGYRGRGVMGGAIAGAMQEVAAALREFRSMPPGEVVTRAGSAVTETFMRHGSRDPKVVEWMNRRVAA